MATPITILTHIVSPELHRASPTHPSTIVAEEPLTTVSLTAHPVALLEEVRGSDHRVLAAAMGSGQ